MNYIVLTVSGESMHDDEDMVLNIQVERTNFLQKVFVAVIA